MKKSVIREWISIQNFYDSKTFKGWMEIINNLKNPQVTSKKCKELIREIKCHLRFPDEGEFVDEDYLEFLIRKLERRIEKYDGFSKEYKLKILEKAKILEQEKKKAEKERNKVLKEKRKARERRRLDKLSVSERKRVRQNLRDQILQEKKKVGKTSSKSKREVLNPKVKKANEYIEDILERFDIHLNILKNSKYEYSVNFLNNFSKIINDILYNSDLIFEGKKFNKDYYLRILYKVNSFKNSEVLHFKKFCESPLQCHFSRPAINPCKVNLRIFNQHKTLVEMLMEEPSDVKMIY